MALRDFVNETNLGRDITYVDISQAFRFLLGIENFIPLRGENIHFTIKGENAVPFPSLGIWLLATMMAKLTQGRVDVAIPRFTELSKAEVTKVFQLSEQELGDLVNGGEISFHEVKNEKFFVVSDIQDYFAKKVSEEVDVPATIDSQEVMKAFKAFPLIPSILSDNEIYVINSPELDPLSLKISKNILNMMLKLASSLTSEHTIISLPLEQYSLSISEAGYILNVSDKDYIHKLISQGLITSRKIGDEERIDLLNLLAFKKVSQQKSYEALEEMRELWEDGITEEFRHLA